MARQKYSIPLLPCENDLAALVEFYRDPAKVLEHVDLIEAARDEALARINQIGDVEDIERLRIEAAADRATAHRLLTSAETAAGEMRARAEADVKAAREAFEAERDATRGKLADREREVAGRERAVTDKEQFLAGREREIDGAIAAANKRRADADAVVADYEGRIERLRAAAGS